MKVLGIDVTVENTEVGYATPVHVTVKHMSPLTKKEGEQLERRIRDILSDNLVHKSSDVPKVCGKVVSFVKGPKLISDQELL